MSQCGNNNELAHQHVPCDRLLQKAYCDYLSHCSEKWFPKLNFQSLYRGFGFVLPHYWVYLSPEGVVLNPEGFVLSPEGDLLTSEGFVLPHFWDYLPPEGVVFLPERN